MNGDIVKKEIPLENSSYNFTIPSYAKVMWIEELVLRSLFLLDSVDATALQNMRQELIVNQIYYLAMLSFKKLSPEELSDFVTKSTELLFDYSK